MYDYAGYRFALMAIPSGRAQYQGNLLIAGVNPLGRNLTYKVGLKLTEM